MYDSVNDEHEYALPSYFTVFPNSQSNSKRIKEKHYCQTNKMLFSPILQSYRSKLSAAKSVFESHLASKIQLKENYFNVLRSDPLFQFLPVEITADTL
jgi:hypothetical protein